MLHIVQSKGKKDRYVPLSKPLVRGIRAYIPAERPEVHLFNGQPSGHQGRAGGDFDSRYGQRWVNRVVKSAATAIAQNAGTTSASSGACKSGRALACALLPRSVYHACSNKPIGYASAKASVRGCCLMRHGKHSRLSESKKVCKWALAVRP